VTIGSGITIEGGTTVGVGYSQIGGYDSSLGAGSNSGTQINNLGTIKATGNGTLTLAGTVTGNGTLDGSAGEIALTGTLNNYTGQALGSLAFAGGTMQGGALSISSGNLIGTSSGGTLNDVTLNGNLNLTAPSSFLTITNGLTLNGTATLGGDAYLGFSGTQTLGGTGAVLFNSTSYPYYYNALVLTQSNTTLTIGTGMTIEGGTTVGAGYSQVGGYDSSLGVGSNSGTQINNLGTIKTTGNGTLTLAGTVTGNGTLDGIGGEIALTGMLSNYTAVAFGSLAFLGGTMQGGALSISSGNLIGTSSGGTLNDVLLNGNLSLTAPSSFLTITNGLTLNGTATLGGDAYLGFSGTQTLGGAGAVVFNSTSYPYYYNALVLTQSNTTLTIGTGITIEGGTTVGVGYSQIGGYDSSLGVGSNSGTQINNLGTIKATGNGTLTLAGTLTGNGTLDGSAGEIALTGTLNNYTAQALGSLAFAGGTMVGGALSISSGNLIGTSSGGTLNDVTLNGSLNLTAPSSFLTITNGLTLNGTATLDGDAYLGFSGTQTLGGTGAVLFNSTSYPYYYNALVLTQSNTTLTIGTGMTIEGGTTVGVGYSQIGGFDSAFGIGSNSGTQIDNLGTIEATANGTLTLAGTLTSNGTLEGSSGLLIINASSTFINDGTLDATNRGSVTITSPMEIDGQGVLINSPLSPITIQNNLLGATKNAAGYSPTGVVTFTGGNSSAPLLLEAMSQDDGANPNGFSNNFAYGAITLGNNSYVRLVDQAQNATSGNNAVYVGVLTVPSGSTLDLNGLDLYAISTSIPVGAHVINGSVNSVSNTGLPDLSPQKATALTSNGVVTVAWNDVNSGAAAVTNSFYDQVQLIDVTSTNTVLATSTLFYNESSSGPILPNGSAAQQTTFNLANYPSFHVGDALQAVITTNVNNNVFESNANNNQVMAAVTQSSVPDLTVTGLSVTGDSTGTVAISWNDTNAGPGPAAINFNDSVIVKDLTTGVQLYSTIVSDNAGQTPISSGASSAENASFKLPTGFNASDSLSVTVNTDVNNSVFESNEGNNSASTTVSGPLAQYPDLQVQGLAVNPTNLVSGGGVTLTWNDVNAGTDVASGAWSDQVQVINETTGQTLLIATPFFPSNSLIAGGSAARSYSFNLPNGPAGAGDLTITVTVNSNNNVYEYNSLGTAETNNSASVPAISQLAVYPDLQVQNLAVVPVAGLQSSGVMTINWSDANTGNGPVTGSFTDLLQVVNTTTGTTLLTLIQA
jgi:hypothetical protein